MTTAPCAANSAQSGRGNYTGPGGYIRTDSSGSDPCHLKHSKVYSIPKVSVIALKGIVQRMTGIPGISDSVAGVCQRDTRSG